MKKKLLILSTSLSLFMVGCDDNYEPNSTTEIDGYYADVEVIKYQDKDTNKKYIIFQSHNGLQVMEDK